MDFRRSKTETGKALRAFLQISLVLITALLAQSCQVKSLEWSSPLQTSITGQVIPLTIAVSGSARSPHAVKHLSCTSAVASLYALNSSGAKIHPALQAVSLNTDGSYAFTGIKALGITVSLYDKLTDPYLVEVIGCNAAYTRLLTATDKQDIDWGTTLIGYTVNTANAAGAATVTAAQLNQLYSGLSAYNDFTTAYTALSGALAPQYTSALGAAPAVLQTATPLALTFTVPAILHETETTTLGLDTTQWNTGFSYGYRWQEDGTTPGTGTTLSGAASFNFTPTANAQGSHTLTVFWGSNDGSGNLDLTKPYSSRSFPITVPNDVPATPPPVSALSAYVNTPAVSLQINTGTGMSNCASFSYLAITEDVSVAPTSPAAYTIACSQPVAQNLSYTLLNGTGDHILYFWAIDASGNIGATATPVTVHYSVVVPVLTFTNPSANGQSFAATVPLTGTCESGSGDVTLTGGITPSPLVTACTSGIFSQSATLSSPDGSKTITASQTNQFGTTGSVAVNLNRDTTVNPFGALTITPTSPGNNTKPTISGSTEGNSTVAFYSQAACAGTVLGSSTAAAGGTFSVTPTASVGADGAYTFSVLATDPLGNTLCSSSLPYVLDTTPPTVTALTTTVTSPTKVSTWPLTITFSESVHNFSLSGIQVANGTVSSLSGSGTSYTATVTPTTDGVVSLQVKAGAALDQAQNPNPASSVLSITYDHTAPAITVTSPLNNSYTNQNPLTFTGTCEYGDALVLGGSGLASPSSATCDNTGHFSVPVTFVTGQGSKNITFQQTDLAGNVGTLSVMVNYDNIAPVMTFTSTAVQTQITNTNTVTFGGTCETGLAIHVTGADTSNSIVCSGTSWTYTSVAQPADGIYTYSFTQTDLAGNTSTAIVGQWTRDTAPPALTRTSPSDGFSTQSSVTLTGACETGLVITFAGTGLTSPILQTCAGGAYTQTLFLTTGDGNKAMTISQTDAATNNTTINATFVRDNTAPVIQQTLVPSPNSTKNNSDTFGGTCEGSLPISVTVSTTVSGTTTTVPDGTATCSAGAWTYTTATQTTDNTYTYTFSQTDAAGNVGSTTAQWKRDTVAPAFVFTTSSSFTTATNSVTFGGTCETGISVTSKLNGSAAGSVSCSGGNWSFPVANQTTDGTYNYTFTQTDAAGNYTTLTGTWVRNTVAPALTLTSPTPVITSTNTATFSGGCANGLSIVISGSASGSLTCSSGAWTYTTTQSTDGTYTFNFQQTDGLGNSTTVQGQMVRDTTPPTVSSLVLAGGAGSTGVSFVNAAMNAADTLTNVAKFCLKQDSAAPTSGDDCWTAVNATPPGLTPSLTMHMATYSYFLSLTPGSYSVYAWAMDAAGNISTNTASAGVDKATISYAVIPPPTLDTPFATNTNVPGYPVPTAQLSVNAGANVYVKWHLTGAGFGTTPIKIEFTEDDSSWTTVTGGVANAAGSGCSLNTSSADSVDTGCYVFASPSNGYLRVRITATDSGGRITALTPPALNTGIFRTIAGNTELGTNTSTLSSVYQVRKAADSSWNEPGAFVISTTGIAYINDFHRGILVINPADGLTKILIPKTGTSTLGSLSSATLTNVLQIALDYQDRLLVWDNDHISRVDLSAGTVTAIIGGGTDTSDSVAVATNLTFEGYQPLPTGPDGEFDWRSLRAKMVPLPNGDIYFASTLGVWFDTGVKIRHYQETGNPQITRINPTGSGYSGDIGNGTSTDITQCAFLDYGLTFDTTSSAITNVLMNLGEHGDSTTTHCAPGNTKVAPGGALAVHEGLLDSTWTTQATQPSPNGTDTWAMYTRITGRNGKLYAIHRGGSSAYSYNPTTRTWTQILGNGQTSTCPDNTAALSCGMDLEDLFVTAQGQIYFMDAGRIRTLNSSNQVVTLFGQALSSGDGGDPLQARISILWSMNLENDGRVLIFDDKNLREVAADHSAISHIAGTGTDAVPSVGSTAATSVFRSGQDWWDSFVVLDPATNDIFYEATDPGIGHNVVGRLVRSSGLWTHGFGGGSTPYYSAAAGTPGDNVILTMYTSGSEWGDGIAPVGYGNGKIALAHSAYPNVAGQNWTQNYIHTYDPSNSWAQNLLVGSNNAFTDDWSPSGTPATSVVTPVFYHVGRMRYATDINQWLMLRTNGDYTSANRIMMAPEGGTASQTFTTFTNLNNSAYSFAYWATGGHQYLYYCATNGNLYRRDVTSGTETQLMLPTAAMSCSTGQSLEIDTVNSLLYFSYTQNYLNAIGVISAI